MLFRSIGANRLQNLSIAISNTHASVILGQDQRAGFSAVNTHFKATSYISIVNKALDKVSTTRSNLGAIQNRLEHTISNLDNTAENLQSAESRIRDVNMADEMVNYSKDSILQQAAQSMLAQANQQTQGVLALLQ